jgi:hypothetical protein
MTAVVTILVLSASIGGTVTLVVGVWLRVHLPAVLQPGDISLYLHHLPVLRVLLRPLWTRGRHAGSGLTDSPLPRDRKRVALPEGDSRATFGSAGRGTDRRLPGGVPADPDQTSAASGRRVAPVGPTPPDMAQSVHGGGNVQLPVVACLATAAIGVPVSSVPVPVPRVAGTDGTPKPPATPTGRTVVPPQPEPTVFVITTAGTWIVRPGGAVEFAPGRDDTAPDSESARGSAVVGGTRAPGDGPQTADPTGESADATPPDAEGSCRRGGTSSFSFLAFLFALDRPPVCQPRGLAGPRRVPAATPAAPVEPVEHTSCSAFSGSRRRGGPQALAEVPLPLQRADLGGSAAAVPPARARAGRSHPPAVGE